ncbi:unnamed protein product [Rotaria sordida]|uniref:NAD(P)(+)--arginine ADP-ribosyltransferase n=1 Tax=Rotaria sordida TaxID=392033 RepID=A0A815DYP1_9BILA|nr:unnamed protein product [Rotaria sordida]CAF3814819.1 unnamed protein product [Rotaria sordida]
MSFRHSPSISSSTSDDSIDLRLRALLHKDYLRQTGLVNHDEILLPYSNYKYRRLERDSINEENAARKFNIERSRKSSKNLMSRYRDTSSEDEIVNSKFHRSRSARIYPDRNLMSSRRNQFYHPASDVYQASEVMMIYRNDSLSSSENDQIVIKQKQNTDDQRLIVYKGYLKNDDTFSFKSQRLAQCPFDIKCYINEHVEVHLLTCCEYKYRQGGFCLGQSFIIEHVAKSIPCQKCRRREKKVNQENIELNSFQTKQVLSDHRSLKSRQRRTSEERTRNDDKQKQEKSENNHIQSNNVHIKSIKSIDHNENHHENSTRKTKMISSSSLIEKKESSSSQQENIQPEHDTKKTNDSSEVENKNNIVSLFHEKLTEQTTSDNDNNGNFLQSLLSILQSGLRRMEQRKLLPPRYEGNVEDFVVILFGTNDESNFNRSIVNFVKMFNNIEELNSFIDTLKFERIILIVSDSLTEFFEDLSRFNSIYILSNNVTRTNDHFNIRGNFPNLESISEKIKEECLIENQFFSIQFASTNETANQSFCYSQLLKETLLKKDNDSNLKKDFIDFSRFHYNNNHNELTLIDEFERNFTIEKSIWWYTRKCFIRKMLNRALRTEEIDILYKMRWFIQALNNQIKENYFSATVYRIHHYSSDQFRKFKEHNANDLLSFGVFLDCTLNEPYLIENIDEMETILFRIKTTVGIEIEQLRYFDSKTEVLLPFDNVYRIESIEENNNDYHHWWTINLAYISTDNEQLKELTKEIREEIESPVVLIQLGKLLLSNNDYSHVDYLARLLFNDGSLKDNLTLLASLAAVHHLLGSVDNRQNNYRAARLQFEQSLKIFLTFIPEDNQILSATYNNIGSMFYQEDQHEQAIIYHQKALQCQLKSSSPDIEAIATYSGNIGAVYLDQGKYDQALLHYKRSLQILQQSIPNAESQSIAMVYDRIASVYWRMDKPAEALPFYQQALQLELKYLPENDHKISVSYFNLSTAYAKLNRLDDAIDCAEKSVQQLLKSVPPNHPEVKENMDQLEGLRRRKWLQQLYE